MPTGPTTVPGGTNGPHYFNHNQKLYEVGADSTLGIVTWGLGTLFTTSHRTIIAQFADGLRSNPAATVAEAADRWGQIFWTAYTASGISTALADLKTLAAKSLHDPTAVSPAPNARTLDEENKFRAYCENLACGFCLGGHLGNDRQPSAFHIDVHPITGIAQPVPIPMGAYRFWGVPNMIDRLIVGFDQQIRNAIVTSQHWSGTEADYNALMQTHMLAHDSLPIRDAVDFVHTCIHSTIKSLKFSRWAQTCGGPIELAVITSDRKFRWVRHKDWDAAITEGIPL